MSGMTHNCIDWTANPPARKTPLLILTRGDDRVYTVVPKDFKTLEDIARKEFDLGDVQVTLSSSCANLCGGLPARITESSWEHVSIYIGCAVVEVAGPKVVDPPPQGVSRKEQPVASEHVDDSSVERQLLSNTDAGEESERADRGLGGNPDASATEPVQDDQDPAPSDHGNDHDDASAPEDQREESLEEEVSAVFPAKSRGWRRVVSEDEDEGEGSEQEHDVPSRPQLLPVASPPRPLQPRLKKERSSVHRPHQDLQSTEPPHEPSKPIKQEKRQSGSGTRPYSQDDRSQPPPSTASHHDTQIESSENQKIMIRVAHRLSKQESKFTTKATTRVAKVLAASCKSFGLDATRATLYLIVSTEDEDGEEENLFPCDRNDSIARAGAERDAESRFLIKIAGEP